MNLKIFILLLVSLPFLAQAQLETYGRYTAGGSVEPNVNYFGTRKITQKISLTFFGLIEQEWSEALIGATYFPSNSFSVNASAGIEQGTIWLMPAYDFQTDKSRIMVGISVKM